MDKGTAVSPNRTTTQTTAAMMTMEATMTMTIINLSTTTVTKSDNLLSAFLSTSS
jgi:hypothetical protein